MKKLFYTTLGIMMLMPLVTFGSSDSYEFEVLPGHVHQSIQSVDGSSVTYFLRHVEISEMYRAKAENYHDMSWTDPTTGHRYTASETAFQEMSDQSYRYYLTRNQESYLVYLHKGITPAGKVLYHKAMWVTSKTRYDYVMNKEFDHPKGGTFKGNTLSHLIDLHWIRISAEEFETTKNTQPGSTNYEFVQEFLEHPELIGKKVQYQGDPREPSDPHVFVLPHVYTSIQANKRKVENVTHVETKHDFRTAEEKIIDQYYDPTITVGSITPEMTQQNPFEDETSYRHRMATLFFTVAKSSVEKSGNNVDVHDLRSEALRFASDQDFETPSIQDEYEALLEKIEKREIIDIQWIDIIHKVKTQSEPVRAKILEELKYAVEINEAKWDIQWDYDQYIQKKTQGKDLSEDKIEKIKAKAEKKKQKALDKIDTDSIRKSAHEFAMNNMY